MPGWVWWQTATLIPEELAEIDTEDILNSVESTWNPKDPNVWYAVEWRDDTSIYPGYFEQDNNNRPLPPNPRVVVDRLFGVVIPIRKFSESVPAGAMGSGAAARRGMANTDAQRARYGDET